MSSAAVPANRRQALIGRCFLHPAFDYLFIGGGLSLFVTAMIAFDPKLGFIPSDVLAYIVLLTGSAHFASSTVRLYTKPGALETWPVLTMVFPLVMLGLITVTVMFPETAGRQFQSLYLTWSPYHYSAQAYGLALMYSARSGCPLGATDRRLLRWVSLVPFFYNFIFGAGAGLRWLVPTDWLVAFPSVVSGINSLLIVLPVLAAVTPVLLYAKVWRGPRGPMPLISMLMVVSNGVWFMLLEPMNAFMWAAIFHAIQYLAIVILFHARERVALPGNARSATQHAAIFYGLSLLLGYGLFQCLPMAYVFAGFGAVESVLMVIAAINIHHFIVDGFIWHLRKDRGNRELAEGVRAAV